MIEATSTKYSIKVHYSIRDMNEREWNDMIDVNILASYGWLKTVEETIIDDVRPAYVLLEEDHQVLGASVYYLHKKTQSIEMLDSQLFGRLKNFLPRVRISFLPAFVCCPMACYGGHLFVKKGLSQQKKQSVMKALLRAIEQQALKARLPLNFMHVTENEPELARFLESRQYIKAFLPPLNFIDIKWSSFSGYLKQVGEKSKNAKSTIKHEINRNKSEGVIIKRLEHIAEHEERIYDLVNQNWLKYNHVPFTYTEHFFSKLKENLKENAIFYASFKNGLLTGVSVLIKMKHTGHVPFLGIDHEAAGNDFTYFNIVYYSPIRDAISEKMSRIYYGRQMYRLKARRGCRTLNLYMYHKPFRSFKKYLVKGWFAFVSMRNVAKVPKDLRITV